MRCGVWPASPFLSGRTAVCGIHTQRAPSCPQFQRKSAHVRALAPRISSWLGRSNELLRGDLSCRAADGRPKITPHPVAPRLDVPKHILRPPYANNKGSSPPDAGPEVHDGKGLKKMRAACQLAARVLEYAGTLVQEGVTTDEIDKKVHQMIIDNGAYPSPLMYSGFPKSVCTSVNEVMCHGIPDARPLQKGDIINIDVTVYLKGYHGDTSAMFYVGEVSEEAQRLCQVTKQAMEAGIQQCRPGAKINAVGKAIQEHAKQHRLAVVGDFIGHGVGRVFHAAPWVIPVANHEQDVMQVGQTFTVEPILVTGRPRVKTWKDDWTAVSADGGLAAQWEHTVLITSTGYELLTVVGGQAPVVDGQKTASRGF